MKSCDSPYNCLGCIACQFFEKGKALLFITLAVLQINDNGWPIIKLVRRDNYFDQIRLNIQSVYGVIDKVIG